jgi:two-component system cell cycle sensor histidine kinase PleC
MAPLKFLHTLFHSLYPRSEIEAEIVEAQLDMLRTSFRLFDFTLPVAGAIIYFFQRFERHGAILVWWAALCLTCLVNEIVLSRKPPPAADRIARARYRARRQVVLCLVLAGVWSSVGYLLWYPAHAPNMMFVEFILVCTLAAIATMATLHAASSTIPLLAVSAAVLAVPMLHDYQTHLVVIGIAAIFVALMLSNAWVIQLRTLHMLRLETERTELIASLRRAKTESDEAHARAIAASRAKSEFLANMSHELRTPLNAIIGFSDIVRSGALGQSCEKYAEYGGFIHQSGNKLLGLIGDVLDLARIEAGRKVLHPEAVDLKSLILDETEKANAAGAEKNVAVSAILPMTLPLLHGDLLALRQILGNLLSNAVKFTPPGGRVEISVIVNACREIEISVADSGIGISVVDQARIFERFGSGRPEIASPQRGSGLGLAIVKGLSDMHGARLNLESAIGEGTRVTVIFPAKSTLDLVGRRVA